MDRIDDAEWAPLRPGWIKQDGLPSTYYDIFAFFLTEIPVETLSYKSKPITSYGWPKNVWKQQKLQKTLLNSMSGEGSGNLVSVSKCSDLKKAFINNGLGKGFHRNRTIERVVFYNLDQNSFLSLFIHIRNALAHGRYQLYNDCFVFEGPKKNAGNDYQIAVRARGILNVKTLLKWIEIIKAGPEQTDQGE